jgi:hypothetical protein
MSDEIDLPPKVLEALRANRKIEAIRLLREERRISLKDAKEEVDGYLAIVAGTETRSLPKADSGVARLVMFCVLFAVGYTVYRFLS